MSRKLTYFDFGGYAEAIRFMLHYGKVDFEDVRYQRDDWPIKSVKDSLPYGQMPIYEENGRVLNQSMAIARYVAKNVGLMPSDSWDQALLDATVLNVYDLAKQLTSYLMSHDPEKKEENKKKVDEILEFFLNRFENELKAGNGHFSGKLSWADFILVGMIETLNVYLPFSVEENYPTVKTLISKIHSLPGVSKYIANRKTYSL